MARTQRLRGVRLGTVAVIVALGGALAEGREDSVRSGAFGLVEMLAGADLLGDVAFLAETDPVRLVAGVQKGLQGDDAYVRAMSARISADLLPGERAAVLPLLVPLLSDELAGPFAADALAAFGEAAAPAIPELTAALQSSDGAVARRAATALGAIGSPALASVPDLERALSKRELVTALDAVVKLQPERAVSLALGATQADTWQLRLAAVRALGEHVDDAEAIEALASALSNDAEGFVRSEAARALRPAKRNELARAAFLAALDDGDPRVRDAASRILKRPVKRPDGPDSQRPDDRLWMIRVCQDYGTFDLIAGDRAHRRAGWISCPDEQPACELLLNWRIGAEMFDVRANPREIPNATMHQVGSCKSLHLPAYDDYVVELRGIAAGVMDIEVSSNPVGFRYLPVWPGMRGRFRLERVGRASGLELELGDVTHTVPLAERLDVASGLPVLRFLVGQTVLEAADRTALLDELRKADKAFVASAIDAGVAALERYVALVSELESAGRLTEADADQLSSSGIYWTHLARVR